MSTRRARLTLGLSIGLLVLVGLAWAADRNGEPRADLVGVAVQAASPSTSVLTTTSTTSTTTVPVPASTSTTVAPPPTTAAPRPSRIPQQLTISALGVDSTVVPVGLEADGSMEIPGVSEVGWYRHGRMPGEAFGSSVLAAHVDYGGARGVFFDLRQLEVGSEVAVVNESGREVRYVVNERFQVDKAELPIDELFRTDGAPTLTLITCGGAFDSSARHYTDNIVVRAVPA